MLKKADLMWVLWKDIHGTGNKTASSNKAVNFRSWGNILGMTVPPPTVRGMKCTKYEIPQYKYPRLTAGKTATARLWKSGLTVDRLHADRTSGRMVAPHDTAGYLGPRTRNTT